MENISLTVTPTYPVTPEELEARRQEFAAITFDSPANYAVGVKAIAQCRGLRGAIEERRKLLKADSLAYGRAVDSAAKSLTAMVEALEAPLLTGRRAVDDQKERVKAEAEAAKRAAVEAELKAKQAAEQARLDAERAELAAERSALEEIRQKARALAEQEEQRLLALKRTQDAIAAAEREALDASRRAFEAEQRQAEQERLTREREAAAARHAEEEQIAELERRAEAERRLAAIQPDLTKMRLFAERIRLLERPVVGDAVKSTMTHAEALLDRAARILEGSK